MGHSFHNCTSAQSVENSTAEIPRSRNSKQHHPLLRSVRQELGRGCRGCPSSHGVRAGVVWVPLDRASGRVSRPSEATLIHGMAADGIRVILIRSTAGAARSLSLKATLTEARHGRYLCPGTRRSGRRVGNGVWMLCQRPRLRRPRRTAVGVRPQRTSEAAGGGNSSSRRRRRA